MQGPLVGGARQNPSMILSPKDRLAPRERPTGRPRLRMRWENLLFLHWSWDPVEIQRVLPPGLCVDTFGGRAWLAVVPFFMRRVHPAGLPNVPGLSDFLELNVRTYAYDARGVPGVWFSSLSCNQPVAVEMARRLFHLNYVHARMSARREGGRVFYSSRRGDGRGTAGFDYQPAGDFHAAGPGSLEFFLAERYVLYSTDASGRLHAGRVHHAPYELAPVRVDRWSFLPASEDGFADPRRPADHLMAAGPLAVDAWPIRPVAIQA